MKAATTKRIVLLFWTLVLMEITGSLLHQPWTHYLVKPLLIPVLAWLVMNHYNVSKRKKILLTGLVFSWLGDIFLLFNSTYPSFFIPGLASFLVTHICYIIYFSDNKTNGISQLTKHPWIVLIVIAYGSGFFIFLSPYLDTLKLPVLVYAITICTMLLCAIHNHGRTSVPANNLYVAGAAMFVLSDTLLALDKFYQPLPYSLVLIMGTYCAAQYLIVTGFLKE